MATKRKNLIKKHGLNKVIAERCNWSFDEVAEQFEEHIEQSVPNYRAGHDLICRFSDYFLRNDSQVYEVGSSTGALARRFLEWNEQRADLHYTGLEISPKMVDFAKSKSAGGKRMNLLCEDITTFELEPCSLVISYYTFQFIHPAYRQAVFNKIYEALEWGGALLVFEKVRGPDARFQDYMNQIYSDLKQEAGFSEVEIINKAQSLKGVLEPFSSAGNLGLMQRAGFRDIMSIYKWVCFEGWLAIK